MFSGSRSWLLCFCCILCLLCLLFSLLSLFLFSKFFLLFSLFLFSLLLFLFFFSLLGIFFKISLAIVHNNFLCFFLVGKKVCISSEEAENSIKETINSTFLLDHGHEDAIKFVVFLHFVAYSKILYQFNSHKNKRH